MKISIIKNPKKGTRFGVYNNRMALYSEGKTGEDYWNEYWDEDHVRNMIRQGQENHYSEVHDYMHYLDKNSLTVEGGCGPGRMVVNMHELGYNIMGIEYDQQTVDFVNKHFPKYKIVQGDIHDIRLKDGEAGGYISLGVAEHFTEGPSKLLNESRRILKKGGRAIFQIPFLNSHRFKLFKFLRVTKPNPDYPGMSFFQYYYSEDEFKSELEKAGYKILEVGYECQEAFLIREHATFSTFWNSKFARNKVKKIIRPFFNSLPGFLNKRYAHTILYVCEAV